MDYPRAATVLDQDAIEARYERCALDVLRGPQSALYGPNIIGGVILMITKGAEEPGLSDELALDAGTRLGRSGVRNAIRQARRQYGQTRLLERWSAVFDDAG
ncbi:hypothetical protein ACMDCT_06195 [Halomonadaceae bacterium KBTZ08]